MLRFEAARKTESLSFCWTDALNEDFLGEIIHESLCITDKKVMILRWIVHSNGKLEAARAFVGACLVTVVLAGCGGIKGGIKKVEGDVGGVVSPIADFQKTEIVTSGSARADGLSEIAVVIHLKNSDNTPVANYKPEYQVVSGIGVLPEECTTSDRNGVSACAVRATQTGTKRLQLTNAKVGLEKDLQFDPPSYSSTQLSLVSGSVKRSTTSIGYKVQMKVQTSIAGADSTTSGGYKAKLSLQGIGN